MYRTIIRPPTIRPQAKVSSKEEKVHLWLEVTNLLIKKAIEQVPPEQRNQGVYLVYFLESKPDKTLRPILDLRGLKQICKEA